MLWSFIACLSTPETQLTGTVFDSSSTPVSQAKVVVHDQDGNMFSQANADPDGFFDVALPTLSTFFIVASAEGMPPQSFTGVSGQGETTVPDGTIWLRQQQEINDRMAEFSQCSQTSMPMIDGQIVVGIPGQSLADLPVVTTASVVALNDDQDAIAGCYLSDTEEPATQTGESGQYAVMGIEAGIHTLRVTVNYDENTVESFDHLIYVPEQGAAPMYPTIIPL